MRALYIGKMLYDVYLTTEEARYWYFHFKKICGIQGVRLAPVPPSAVWLIYYKLEEGVS
jgi:hypothetical protein